jgi:hypothetical protein
MLMSADLYTITTPEGVSHTGLVHGSGGHLKGDRGLLVLQLAASGRPVNVYDPMRKAPFHGPAYRVIEAVSMYPEYDTEFARRTTIKIAGCTIVKAGSE